MTWNLKTCLILGLSVCFFGGGFCDTTPNYFCADMNPQHHVIIDQLMGMWFGIELINHLEERHYVKGEPSCPIIHISEERISSTTFNPLHKNYKYGDNYGKGHGYQTQRPITYDVTSQQEMRRRIYEQSEYDRQTTYGNYPASRRHHTYDNLDRQNIEMKNLRLYWDENGESTEFHMRYNVSRAGFWISSGPENGGASLDPQYSHFAGTIQVLKAVGSHLVLTFCHQLPDRQLYSILLSRELKLDHVDILGVHNMLQRRGLRTNNVKKLCNGSKKHGLSDVLIFVILAIPVFSRLLTSTFN